MEHGRFEAKFLVLLKVIWTYEMVKKASIRCLCMAMNELMCGNVCVNNAQDQWLRKNGVNISGSNHCGIELNEMLCMFVCVCVCCAHSLVRSFISLAWMSFASKRAPSPLMLTYSPYCMAYKISHRTNRSSFHSSFNVLNLAFAERSSHRYELLIANTDHDELTSSHIDVNWWLFSLCFFFLLLFRIALKSQNESK